MELEQQTKRPLVETYAVPILIVAIGAGFLAISGGLTSRSDLLSDAQFSELQERVMTSGGVELPVVWGDLGRRLVETGAIDDTKWGELYGTLSEAEKLLLDGDNPERMRITRENAPYLLNLFWAFGLANKNPILEDKKGMMNPAYGGAGGFASTGGWILSRGDPMEHYNTHSLVTLTEAQQELIDKISRGIYRPCCDNPTHFPDCNHGMAMLGFLELMVSQGASESEMWEAALAVNSFWFPDTYLTIATYMLQRGTLWKDVDAREVLGRDYSSASGYARVASEVQSQGGQGSSCGV